MIQETKHGKTVRIGNRKVEKLRGGRPSEVMKNKKKYSRKIKHKGRSECQ